MEKIKFLNQRRKEKKERRIMSNKNLKSFYTKFPVVFLGPTTSSSTSKPSSPLPAKAFILRCRPALTVGKVLQPIMEKYNVDTEQVIVCLAGTCDVLKLETPVSNVYQKTLAVMTQQQFAERKLLPKREYQKELSIAPNWMLAPSDQSSPGGSTDSHHPPFHQQGDVGFCEIPLEPEGGSKLGGGLLLKHSAPKAVGLVAPSDISYCGEIEPSEEPAPLQESCSRYSVPSSMAQHESITFTSAALTGGTSSSSQTRIVRMNEGEEVNLPRIPCWRK